ncbi:MAG: CidA/LrgA family protein [Breznakibacter sp.]
MLQGLFFIFLFFALGNLVSSLIGGWLPGSVIGMVMLFVSLLAGWIKPDRVKKAADGIIGHMALYFVPVGVGLMTSVSLIGRHFWAILVSSVVSTVLVIVTTALVQQKMEKWKK